MNITIPRIQVQMSEDFLVFALFETHSPKANAPPDFSIREMMLPISPHTMISHAISSLIIVF